MPNWPWIERTFNFDFPASKFPDLLERVRGTPVRVEALVKGLSHDVLTRSPGSGWSIQENVGHLIDLGYLALQRVGEILTGKDVLVAADMTNRKTHEANHNARNMADLLTELRSERAQLVSRLEQLDESDWSKSALHPRLHQPMRIVDIAHFDSEHDDYHLARISELKRKFGKVR
ncbi:MAG: DinB family protein [Planctomycetes bacterium]|nr:DinB family protein [Planctomycetota bacterium]